MVDLTKLRKQIISISLHHGGYFVTTFLYSALPLLFLPILTRYLAPEEYANIALFRFYMAISNSLVGVSLPIMISKNFFDKPKEYVSRIIGSSVVVVLLFTAILTILIILLQNPIVAFLELPLFWILIIPWTSLCYVIFMMALTVMRNQKKVLLFSKHKIANSIFNISISVLLVVVFVWGWRGRLWGIVFSYVISVILAVYYLMSNNFISFKISKDIIKKIIELVVPLIPNSLQTIIVGQIGIFFMQYYYTKELLGIYSVGFQISYAIKLIFKSIAMSWSPYVYEQLATPNKTNRLMLARFYYVLTLILLAGVAFINLFADLILRIITTSAYFGAKDFILWFTIGFFFSGMTIFFMPVLMKHEKQKYVSIISIINMIVLVGLNITLVKLFESVGIAMAFSISAFFMFIAYFAMSQRVFGLPWFKALLIWKK